jgi:hypothetical protein
MSKHPPLDRARMLRAIKSLEKCLPSPARLVVGGGAAMVLAYDYPLATSDVDAFAAAGGLRMAELDRSARQVAAELDLEPDWLNAHFETYTGVLPEGYSARLRSVYRGERLVVDALGPEDLLVMKCFAGRDKDLAHARKLLRLAGDLDLVDAHLAHLIERRYPGAERAADWFDDLRDDEGL